ncbi:hypothetical protein [Methylovirgula sp. HY1]|uniref:hypothetical protein n=1 Tax=Methylovirgula sp. HY1 TaxID=2822761 RepID=UPI001C5B6C6E|nr:hypothetical protein [Methylovirgula sp. HY1]QXX75602.1 hypothetical protein MHY1_02432 [Methylovirgula sp. HY1]
MRTINANKAGLTLGALLGGWHFLWALLVAFHWAQPLVDFLFWIHFIKPVYVIEAFTAGRAIILVVITSAIGYVVGLCFGLLWNRFHQH